MNKPTPPACKTRNWPSCKDALRRRGSLTIWFDPALTREAAPTGKRGRQPGYLHSWIRQEIATDRQIGTTLAIC